MDDHRRGPTRRGPTRLGSTHLGATRRWGGHPGAALCFLALLALHLGWGLRISRVVHADERWTLAAIQQGTGNLLHTILFKDNHPPLYYLISHAWIGLGGSSIAHVRLLSYCFALATLAVFALFHLRTRTIPFYVPLLLIGSNPLFTYYAATTRPYALVVMLAAFTLCSALWLREQKNGVDGATAEKKNRILRTIFFLSCLLLGLTHYYGTLLALVLLTIDLFERKIDRSGLHNWITGSLLLVWPILQIINNTPGEQLSSNSWVRVVPLVSTVNNFLLGNFPVLMLSREPHMIIGMVLLACLSTSLLPGHPWRLRLAWPNPLNWPHPFNWQNHRQEWSLSLSTWSRQLHSALDNRLIYLASIILIVLGLSAVVDCLAPFTTPYYFLVCLPATALLVEAFHRRVHGQLGPWSAGLLVTGIVGCQLLLGAQRLAQA